MQNVSSPRVFEIFHYFFSQRLDICNSQLIFGQFFQKNVLEAFGPQKSKFTNGKETFLPPEGLQNIFWKNCPKVNCPL